MYCFSETDVAEKKTVKVIFAEKIHNKQLILKKLKKELSTHLSFDKVTKKVNRKIIDKEITLSKLEKVPSKSNIIVRKSDIESTDTGDDTRYYARQSIAQCRMEKFLSMTAADMPAPTVKQLACMNPVLKTPKDTIRCTNCDVLYDPSKKSEHLKTCTKAKPKTLIFGCVQCSFKHSSKDVVTQHIKDVHK